MPEKKQVIRFRDEVDVSVEKYDDDFGQFTIENEPKSLSRGTSTVDGNNHLYGITLDEFKEVTKNFDGNTILCVRDSNREGAVPLKYARTAAIANTDQKILTLAGSETHFPISYFGKVEGIRTYSKFNQGVNDNSTVSELKEDEEIVSGERIK